MGQRKGAFPAYRCLSTQMPECRARRRFGALCLAIDRQSERSWAPTFCERPLFGNASSSTSFSVVVAGFSLIWRCTHRAQLSIQSIIGKFELGPASGSTSGPTPTPQRLLCAGSSLHMLQQSCSRCRGYPLTRPRRSRPGRLPRACAVDGCAGCGQARRRRAAAARSGFLRAPGWQAPNVQASSA